MWISSNHILLNIPGQNKITTFTFFLSFTAACISVTACPAWKSHTKSPAGMQRDDDDGNDGSDGADGTNDGDGGYYDDYGEGEHA